MASKIDNAAAGDMTNNVDEYSVDLVEIDSPTGIKKFGWTNSKFSQNMGYYKTIPEVGSTIDTKAFWTVGKGCKAKTPAEQKRIDNMRGHGKDTFNSIMENNVKMYNVGGDAFCEIVREKTVFDTIRTWFGLVKKGKPINLKPLNPNRVKTITNAAGMIIEYEYDNGVNKEPTTYKAEDIFHLPWNKIGDEPHGTSTLEKIERIILMRNEAMEDMKIVFHRYVKPLWIWQLDTESPTKIASFKAKADSTVQNAENIYIPKGAAEAERVSVPQYSTLDPLPWIQNLTQYFYQATNTPDVILGSAKETVEASAKILYLAFQQSIEKNQLFLEEQIKAQLGIEVNFEFPASIQADLLGTEKKDGGSATKLKPSETTAGAKGKK